MRRILVVSTVAVAAAAALTGAGIALAQSPTDPMDPASWYGYVCGDDGAVLRWLARSAYVVAGASVLANFRSKLPPQARVVVDFFAANLWTMLKGAATKTSVLLAAVVLAAVAACSSADVGTSKAAADALCASLRTGTADAQGSLKGGALGTANSIAVYVQGACTAEGVVTALLSDPSTLEWLGKLNGQVQALKAAPAA